MSDHNHCSVCGAALFNKQPCEVCSKRERIGSSELLGRGVRVIAECPSFPVRYGVISGESRDGKCWWIRPDGKKTPLSYHKRFVRKAP